METEAEKVVRGWREAFEGKVNWSTWMKCRILTLEADYHRRHGREEVAKAVEALAREVAN